MAYGVYKSVNKILVTVPFFPLSMVAFPGELVNLHIFEERYRQLFRELEAGEVDRFVLLPHIDGRLRSRGTVMRLQRVAKAYESGESDVEVLGTDVVEVRSFSKQLPGKPYAGGETRATELVLSASDDTNAALLIERCGDLMRTLGVHKHLPDPELPGLSFAIGHLAGLSPAQEYRLLSLKTEDERQGYLLNQIARSIRTAKKAREMRKQIQMNGHYRYLTENG